VQIRHFTALWSMAPVVEALQALRGFAMGLGPVAAPWLTFHHGGDGSVRGAYSAALPSRGS